MATWGPTWTTSNTYVVYRVGYDLLSQSVADNTSTIRAYLQADRTNTGYTTWGQADLWLSADYGWQSSSEQVTIGSEWVTILTRDFTVAHAADGTKTLRLHGQFRISSIGLTSTGYGDGQSTTFSLPTIPRASSFTLSASSVAMGSAITVTITRASSAFTHDVKLTWNGSTTTAGSKITATSLSYTIPTSWGSAIPSASSGSCTVTVDTYSGTTRIGTASRTLTVTVPSTATPTLGSLTLAQVYDALTPAVPSGWGVYVQSRSGVKATLASAAGQMGATIASITISGGGYSITGTGRVLTTGAVNASGTVTFTAKATDSRGRTASVTASVSFVAYVPPSFASVLSQRADSSSQIAADGTYGAATAVYAFASVSGKNAVTRALRWREEGTSSWSVVAAGFNSGTTRFFGAGALAVTKAYDVEYTITDAFNTVTHTDQISVSRPVLKVDPTGTMLALFGEPTNLGVDIKSDLYLKGDRLALPVSVANGGTGRTSAPSMLTDLGSDTAASPLAASPRPGVTGVLPIANGGTGMASVESTVLTASGLTFTFSRWGPIGSLSIVGTTTAAISAWTNLVATPNGYVPETMCLMASYPLDKNFRVASQVTTATAIASGVACAATGLYILA